MFFAIMLKKIKKHQGITSLFKIMLYILCIFSMKYLPIEFKCLRRHIIYTSLSHRK